MNREIKFRVWIKIEKRIAHVHSLTWLDGDKYAGRLFLSIDNGKRAGEVDDSVVLMQYTGLEDKNGKEVYEGDIVQIQTMKEGKYQNEKVEVTFSMGQFGFWGEPLRDFNTQCEKMGNIHENPELLAEKGLLK